MNSQKSEAQAHRGQHKGSREPLTTERTFDAANVVDLGIAEA